MSSCPRLPARSDSSFVANAAGKGGSGGGIWVEDGAKAVLARTEFVNNTAASSYTHKGAGGGVAVSASASLTMSEGCVLEGNVAGPEVWGRGGGARSLGVGVFVAAVLRLVVIGNYISFLIGGSSGVVYVVSRLVSLASRGCTISFAVPGTERFR